MKKTTFSGIVTLFLCVMIVSSCAKNEYDMWQGNDPATISAKHLQAIEQLGFDISTIWEFEDYYVVEEDIRIIKADLDSYISDPATRQYHTGNPVTRQNATDIKVHISNVIRNNRGQQDWVQAIEEALEAWNSVPNSCVNMRITYSSSDADIRIIRDTEYSQKFPNNTFGMGTFPVNGKPGDLVVVNFEFNYGNTHLSRVWNVVHELGHNMGFRHTNWQSNGESKDGGGVTAEHVPGTPTGAENRSVFTGGVAGTTWAGFSAYDIIAIQYLFSPTETEVISISVNSSDSPLMPNKEYTFTATVTGMGSGYPNPKVRFDIAGTYQSLADPEIINTGDLSTTVKFTESGEYSVKATLLNFTPVITGTERYSVYCNSGTIEETVYLQNGYAIINSITDAHNYDPQSVYQWEVDYGNGWTATELTGSSVTVAASAEHFKVLYRRIHICGSGGRYASNICTVINPDLVATQGGRIVERVDRNLYRWSHGLQIPSMEAPPAEVLSYYWEIYESGEWQRYGDATTAELNIYGYNLGIDQARIRRIAETQYGPAYSNECLVVEHCFNADLSLGNSFSNPIVLGTYNTDFYVKGMVDTSGPGFTDLDRATGFGNDGVVELTLNQDYMVRIALHSPQLRDLHISIHPPYESDIDYFMGPIPYHLELEVFDEIDDTACIHRFMSAGTYHITMQGRKMMNQSQPHGPIYFSFTGTLPEL